MISGEKKREFWVTVLLLLGFWMLLSIPSSIDTRESVINLIQHLILGFILAVFVAYISSKPILSYREVHIHTFASIFRLISYLVFLLKEIMKAGIDVANRVLRKDMLISPGIVEFHTPFKDDLRITLNANSITLTPGTITIDVKKVDDGSIFYVHCISQDAVKDIAEGGGFVQKILNIYGERNDV